MTVRQVWLLIVLSLTSITLCYSYEHIESFKYNQEISLSGVVVTIPKQDNDMLEFVFHTYKYGDILLKANNSYRHYLMPANKLTLLAKIYKPHEYDNTNAFNYYKYLEHHSIVGVGNVKSGSKITYNGTAILSLPKRFRYYIYSHLQSQLKESKLKPFVLALLIGDKDFTKSEQTLLVNSGTSHLMVISGLHIGLLAFIAFLIFRGIWSFSPKLCRKLPAQYVGTICSIIVAFSYSLLAGFSLPTQRAVIMLLIVVVLWLLKKRVSITQSLFIAFVIIMLLDFKSIYSTSLWLSFSAVSILILISILLQQYKSRLALFLLPQVYLTIFLIPISVYYFSSFSLVSILANIVAIPLVSFVILPLLLFCLVISFIGLKLWFIPILFLKLLYIYLEFLTKHIQLIEYWSYFSLASLVIVIIGIILLIFPFSKSVRLLGLVMCLVFFQSSTDLSKKYKYFQLHVFDTRDQMVLIQNKGQNLLYTSVKNLSNKYILSNILENYLKLEGIDKVDYLIVVDNQKKLNLEGIKQTIDVERIISNIDNDSSPYVIKCSYKNNLSFGNLRIKFLSNQNTCLVDISYLDKEFLLFDNASLKSQEKVFNLYNRVVSPNIIITPTELYPSFINNELDYIIYISNKVEELYQINNLKQEVFDTYANGAITVQIDQNNKLNIISQLKKY
ncbi:ComEC/Rec2 family competence protein [Francisella sp. 19X1-34]|uniref:ComEC/Rec2 family competence protein n=1 Tax=Francisella sp. 19X1-34 TaxID=3087177 RepID=UPI002E37ED91|nr:ComEC/Rec2 family competence protein [Francisella sp. 19X1-34]MED7789108.1 ComEC/Rec2 family competence protein [Francisella sp. 19X1-34]